ncbi:hypothetical protein SCUCBS95973_001132 [Sporothrix curviconia]|uniref:Uncharacterized protein n=1 Tax=Sporothrix curviconia TaxID=1260050 RepID=A0ABP0AW95_9PEZI
MPLGGSVTYGSESSDGNGYRKFLRDKLIRGGYRVEMVGSRKSGPPSLCPISGPTSSQSTPAPTTAFKTLSSG